MKEGLFPMPMPEPPSGGSGDSGGHAGEASPQDVLYEEPKTEMTGGSNGHGEPGGK